MTTAGQILKLLTAENLAYAIQNQENAVGALTLQREDLEKRLATAREQLKALYAEEKRRETWAKTRKLRHA